MKKDVVGRNGMSWITCAQPYDLRLDFCAYISTNIASVDPKALFSLGTPRFLNMAAGLRHATFSDYVYKHTWVQTTDAKTEFML